MWKMRPSTLNELATITTINSLLSHTHTHSQLFFKPKIPFYTFTCCCSCCWPDDKWTTPPSDTYTHKSLPSSSSPFISNWRGRGECIHLSYVHNRSADIYKYICGWTTITSRTRPAGIFIRGPWRDLKKKKKESTKANKRKRITRRKSRRETPLFKS